MMPIRYPVAAPLLSGKEKDYVLDCLDSTWISSSGVYIERLESDFAHFCETKHAVVCSSGTTALHLALLAHGIGKDDEVILPTLTFVATANAVTYCGAKPVFVDVEPDTWNIDATRIEAVITPQTKGIIAVHLYGHPADMNAIREVADKHGLFVVEDAAEAMGATHDRRRVGSLGDSAMFSLFGNKIITTGEGGVVTTNDDDVAATVRLLRGQGMSSGRRYWPTVIGYNYRMTNLQAAIGCAQMEQVDWLIEQRRRVARLYRDALKDYQAVTLPVEKVWAKNVYWMFSIVLNEATQANRDELMRRLETQGIETRPFFYPMHILPPYLGLQPNTAFPVANRVSAKGINLPSYGSLTDTDISFISTTLEREWEDIRS